MYISLRESRANGFKQWSDSHQNAEEGRSSAVPDPAIARPSMTIPARSAHPSLLIAETTL